MYCTANAKKLNAWLGSSSYLPLFLNFRMEAAAWGRYVSAFCSAFGVVIIMSVQDHGVGGVFAEIPTCSSQMTRWVIWRGLTEHAGGQDLTFECHCELQQFNTKLLKHCSTPVLVLNRHIWVYYLTNTIICSFLSSHEWLYTTNSNTTQHLPMRVLVLVKPSDLQGNTHNNMVEV